MAHLNLLLKPVVLSNDKKADLIGIIEGERTLNRELALDSSRLLAEWKQIGLDPAEARTRVVKSSSTYAACQAKQR